MSESSGYIRHCDGRIGILLHDIKQTNTGEPFPAWYSNDVLLIQSVTKNYEKRNWS
jgi:hypothetical protein